jgi:hypothetical protein
MARNCAPTDGRSGLWMMTGPMRSALPSLADHHRACRLQPHGERRPDPLSPSRHFGANGERVRVRGSRKGMPITEEPPTCAESSPGAPTAPACSGHAPYRPRRSCGHVCRNRRLGGHKLVRQVPIGPYFADFVCRERKVIIEVDGGTHSTDREIADDAKRTSDLQALASSASATTQHRLRARRSAGLHRGRALTGRGPWLSDRVDP